MFRFLFGKKIVNSDDVVCRTLICAITNDCHKSTIQLYIWGYIFSWLHTDCKVYVLYFFKVCLLQAVYSILDTWALFWTANTSTCLTVIRHELGTCKTNSHNKPQVKTCLLAWLLHGRIGKLKLMKGKNVKRHYIIKDEFG